MPRTVLASVVLLACGCGAAATSLPDRLDAALAPFANDGHRDLDAIVVVIDGRTVYERYFNGETADTLHDIRSATKSITSLLVGIALDRGAIPSIADRVETYVPETRGKPAGAVPLSAVLTMRSGLDADDRDDDSPGNETRMDAAAHMLELVASLPAREPPGARYVYNSATAYLAGIALARAVGRTEEDFAREVLFEPLGIARWAWRRDGDGNTTGQGNLSLTARAFAAIGQLVLDRGSYRGRTIASAAWIDESLAPKVQIGERDRYADGYGYFWYATRQHIGGDDIPVSFASGNGGNKIYVVPSRHMVVAVTSSAYNQGYGQRRSEEILRAILAIVSRAGTS